MKSTIRPLGIKLLIGHYHLGARPDSIDTPTFIPRRLIKGCLYKENVPYDDNPVRGMPFASLRLLARTLTLFEVLSLRKPEVVPNRMLDSFEVLQRLVQLERAGFHPLDFDARRKMNSLTKMAADILFLQRLQSDDKLSFDSSCVYWAMDFKSEFAARVVVLFLERMARPEQRELKLLKEMGLEYMMETDLARPELLVELGAVSHGRLRNRIRQALKNIGRHDLLDLMGNGGPPIVEQELMAGESQSESGQAAPAQAESERASTQAESERA